MIAFSEVALRLGAAAILGGLVGLERERKDGVAGMRTHMMVCLGSALIMMVSAFGFGDILGTPNVDLDPSRIAAQVVSGIGFLGAGTILFLRQEVIRGLTTAAALWTVAGIGLAIGGGMYLAALMATGITIIILWLLKPIEKKLFRNRYQILRIVTSAQVDLEKNVYQMLEQHHIEIMSLSMTRDGDEFIIQIRFLNKNKQLNAMVDTINELKKTTDIRQVSWDKNQ